MKKLQLKFDGMKNMLTKEQMKKVVGGSGSTQISTLGPPDGGTCYYYCCPSSCSHSFANAVDNSVSTNEDCQQSYLYTYGNTCSGGDYLAALLKS